MRRLLVTDTLQRIAYKATSFVPLLKLAHSSLDFFVSSIIILVYKQHTVTHMRKIETQMNTAIRSRKDFRSANTEVANFYCSATDRVGSIVKLHGNKIAEVYANSIVLFDGGWQTVTTKSRLNAILNEFSAGTGVIQRNYEWFLAYKNLKEDFISGMEVAL